MLYPSITSPPYPPNLNRNFRLIEALSQTLSPLFTSFFLCIFSSSDTFIAYPISACLTTYISHSNLPFAPSPRALINLPSLFTKSATDLITLRMSLSNIIVSNIYRIPRVRDLPPPPSATSTSVLWSSFFQFRSWGYLPPHSCLGCLLAPSQPKVCPR